MDYDTNPRDIVRTLVLSRDRMSNVGLDMLVS